MINYEVLEGIKNWDPKKSSSLVDLLVEVREILRQSEFQRSFEFSEDKVSRRCRDEPSRCQGVLAGEV